ncbi:MAG: O-methyltransferase [Lachnospiraceae bacterium]
MIVDERIEAYIDSLDKGNTPFLNELEAYAKKNEVPVIKRPTQNLLRLLLQMKRPESILEIGTAIGFSALLMAEYGPKDCPITTIEKYEKRILAAKENFKKAGRDRQILLLEGDAADILRDLSKKQPRSFDFIFMDAAKGQYLRFLPDILLLLRQGGLLISDNVLQDGDIVESRFAVTRRNRTIHSRMRDYLYALTNDETLQTAVLPLGDGVTVSVKK